MRCGRPASGVHPMNGPGSGLELLRPESVEHAVAIIGNGSVGLAGGTDLVPLLRDGLVRADTLVDLRGIVPRGIGETTRPVLPEERSAGTDATEDARRSGLTIGAGTTLAELEADSQTPQALREACAVAASPQLRAMGTIGGNLLQATRCWYWRLKFPCYLHGGERCHAREGEHREHAIFGNERCASAHPSDPAAALLALDARIRTSRRELAVGDLYRLPTDDDRNVTTLGDGEIILELDVPVPDASVYLKAMDRRAWAFPLIGVAGVRRRTEVRLALAGAAPVPWLVEEPDTLGSATPLPGTAYKVELARTLIRRARDALG